MQKFMVGKSGKIRNILLILFGIILIYIWNIAIRPTVHHLIGCSDKRSKRLLETSCNLYRKGQIVGDLCPLICDKEQVKYKSCMNHIGGKSVLVMTCDDACVPGQVVKTVLKTDIRDNIDNFEHKFLGSWQDKLPSNLAEFRSTIKQTALKNFGINMSQSEDVIQKIFQPEYDQYINPLTDQKYKAFVLTVWSLVQQDEYLLTKLHQNSPLFPRIYHSCGSLYLMESAPPGDILDRPWVPWKNRYASWRDRATIAIKLLDAISYMNNNLHETLHMCDVKGGNFGIGADGFIKLIDVDSVVFSQKFAHLMLERKCKKDRDCKWGCECHGKCVSGHCIIQRTNNNLQGICEGVLMPQYFRTSLLRDPPDSIKSQLEDIFKHCVPPFKNKLDEKVTIDIHWKLYNLLKSTLL